MIDVIMLGAIFVCWSILVVLSWFPSLFISIKRPDSQSDSTHIVESGKENRLDIYV